MSRVYSRRERILFGLMAPLALAVGAIGAYFTVSDSQGRVFWIMAALGGFGGLVVCLRIVITGQAGRAMEQDALDALL